MSKTPDVPLGPARPPQYADGSHVRKARLAVRKNNKTRILHEKPELAKHGMKKALKKD